MNRTFHATSHNYVMSKTVLSYFYTLSPTWSPESCMVSPVKVAKIASVLWGKLHSWFSQQKWSAIIIVSHGSLKSLPAYWCCLVPNDFMGYSPIQKVLARDGCWQNHVQNGSRAQRGTIQYLRLEGLIFSWHRKMAMRRSPSPSWKII